MHLCLVLHNITRLSWSKKDRWGAEDFLFREVSGLGLTSILPTKLWIIMKAACPELESCRRRAPQGQPSILTEGSKFMLAEIQPEERRQRGPSLLLLCPQSWCEERGWRTAASWRKDWSRSSVPAVRNLSTMLRASLLAAADITNDVSNVSPAARN